MTRRRPLFLTVVSWWQREKTTLESPLYVASEMITLHVARQQEQGQRQGLEPGELQLMGLGCSQATLEVSERTEAWKDGAAMNSPPGGFVEGQLSP